MRFLNNFFINNSEKESGVNIETKVLNENENLEVEKTDQNYSKKLFLNRLAWAIIGVIVLFLSYQKVLNTKIKEGIFQSRARIINVKTDNFNQRIYIFKTDFGNLEGKHEEYLKLGELYEVEGKYKTFKFGENSFKNYLLSTATLGEIEKVKILEKFPCDNACKFYGFKDAVSRNISQKFMNYTCLNIFKPQDLGVNCGDVAIFARGLLIGDVSALSKESKENIKNFGLTHLIAVSGFQVACIAAFLTAVFKFLWFGPKTRYFLISLFLLAFLFLVGNQPPILRATLSFLIIKGFLLIARRMSVVRGLFFAGLIMLLLNPFLIISYSFWLSVLATLGVIFASKIIDLLEIKNSFIQIIIVCISAYFFTLGIILSLNPFTNPLAILLNILVSPAIPLISIFLLLSLIPVIGQYIFIPASYLLTFLLGNLQDLSLNSSKYQINFGDKFSFLDILVYYAFLFSILFLIYKRMRQILTKDKNQSLLLDKPRWWNW